MTSPTDPTRWIDDPDAGELGIATRAAQERGPSEEQLAAMAKAVGAGAAAAAVSLGATSSAAAVASHTTIALPLLVTLGAAAVVAVVVASTRPEPTVEVPPAQHILTKPVDVPSIEVAAPVERELPPPAPTEQRPKSRAQRNAPVAAAPVVPAVEPTAPVVAPVLAPAPIDAAALMREEANLVRRAESSLGTDPALALRLVEEHAARFPRGALDQEASVVAIDALLRLGRVSEAEARARAFEDAHAGSIHVRRIRQLIEAHER